MYPTPSNVPGVLFVVLWYWMCSISFFWGGAIHQDRYSMCSQVVSKFRSQNLP